MVESTNRVQLKFKVWNICLELINVGGSQRICKQLVNVWKNFRLKALRQNQYQSRTRFYSREICFSSCSWKVESRTPKLHEDWDKEEDGGGGREGGEGGGEEENSVSLIRERDRKRQILIISTVYFTVLPDCVISSRAISWSSLSSLSLSLPLSSPRKRERFLSFLPSILQYCLKVWFLGWCSFLELLKEFFFLSLSSSREREILIISTVYLTILPDGVISGRAASWSSLCSKNRPSDFSLGFMIFVVVNGPRVGFLLE